MDLASSLQMCFYFFIDHVLYSGEGHLYLGLQCFSDVSYNRKHNYLPLQVRSKPGQFCEQYETSKLTYRFFGTRGLGP